MKIDKSDSAIVFIDPQNDVLSEKGKNWAAVRKSVTENKTVENMERIFIAARDRGISRLHISTLFLSHRRHLENQWAARSG
ncbi:MAG: hypothetical protein WDN69_29965 [Aliidongia sp.]